MLLVLTLSLLGGVALCLQFRLLGIKDLVASPPLDNKNLLRASPSERGRDPVFGWLAELKGYA